MFCGIGGFDLALNNNGWRCVGCSEIDKYANAVYQHHWPEVKNFGDATTIDTGQLPAFDLLVAGFPCQAFSMAGNRRGFDDTRGTLFFQIARVAEAKKPSLLLLENVRGLLNHEQGQTFKTILSTLDDLGYDAEWQVLDSAGFGVPQHRDRVYIVGHLRGRRTEPIFPIEPITHGDIKVCYRSPLKYRQTTQAYSERGVSTTLACHSASRILIGERKRLVTPTECERLQGFPDGWTAKGMIGNKEIDISDNQRYYMLGNAVTVPVVDAIVGKL